MRTRRPIKFPVASITIDSLNGIIPAPIATGYAHRTTVVGSQHAKDAPRSMLRDHPPGKVGREEVMIRRRFNPAPAELLAHLTTSARKVLGDLDFHVTKISLSGVALSLPLVGIIGFACSGRTALQPAVPIVRNKWLALVFLC